MTRTWPNDVITVTSLASGTVQLASVVQVRHVDGVMEVRCDDGPWGPLADSHDVQTLPASKVPLDFHANNRAQRRARAARARRAR